LFKNNISIEKGQETIMLEAAEGDKNKITHSIFRSALEKAIC
jgi:hypothetical protein